MSGVLLSHSPLYYFCSGPLTEPVHSVLTQLAWLSCKPQGSSCIHRSSAENTGVYCHTRPSLHGCWGIEYSSPCYMTRAFHPLTHLPSIPPLCKCCFGFKSSQNQYIRWLIWSYLCLKANHLTDFTTPQNVQCVFQILKGRSFHLPPHHPKEADE